MHVRRVTAFVGSARRRHTYHAALQFLDGLKALGGVEYEIVALSDHHLGVCRGCRACMDKGEEWCPLKDDRDMLIEKIMTSDGVVFATPNYSFQVSAIMKTFLDRIGFAFHRPRFFGKTSTSIVAQGIYGGDKIVKYLDFVGYGLGFNAVMGSCIRSIEPVTEKRRKATEQTLAKHSKRFHERLMGPSYPAPTFMDLMIFRMARQSIRLMLDEGSRDHTYYKDKGWFESDFYYPARLGVTKKLAGSLFDSIGTRMYRQRPA